MLGALYLHIPFCARKCAYCDFASWATDAHDPQMAHYTNALLEQLWTVAKAGLLQSCTTAYVGGGTPSLLGADTLESLVRGIRAACPELTELTCEANPDSLTDKVLDALVRAEATRISIGVQSLEDTELRELGRLHTAAQAHERLHAAVKSGLDVSADLMCALPQQTKASWLRSLRGVVETGVTHVSVYTLALEEGTPLERRYADEPTPWNDEDVQAECMEQASQELSSAGFARYEVANYARPGKECAHNRAYWTGVPYLGLGTGAASMVDEVGYESLRSLCPQLPPLPEGMYRIRLRITSSKEELIRDPDLANLGFAVEFLDERQAAAEDLMLGMRMVRGVGPRLLAWCPPSLLHDLEGRGLVRFEGGRMRPTQDGWLLGNELYGALWDLAGRPVIETSC